MSEGVTYTTNWPDGIERDIDDLEYHRMSRRDMEWGEGTTEPGYLPTYWISLSCPFKEESDD